MGQGKKSHGTLIDWCTGIEWPVNCMIVISAWWRSNMPFQRMSGRLSGRLNYYITLWKQEVSELESDELETSCGRESQQKAEPPGLRLSIRRNENDTRLCPEGAGEVNTLQSLFGLQLPLTGKPYNKVRGTYFLKKSSLVFYSLRQYVYICICRWILHMYMYYVFCIVYHGHGYTTFTHSWRENDWIHTFPKGISAMWNAISLVQDLNSCRCVHSLRR